MAREKAEEGLTSLGAQRTDYGYDYAPEALETFQNQHTDHDYWVRFNCPEFTTLCPITGQPDYGTIYISYMPAERMVESKSLKLYLVSFRNHGDFHEDVVNVIMRDLIRLMAPKYIEVQGKFLPRGGIRAAAARSIPTQTTASRGRSTRHWRGSASRSTTVYRNGWTTVDGAAKKDRPHQ